jgi:hypothetical protein
MMRYERNKGDLRERKLNEVARAEVEKQEALLEYVAAMADIELPEDGSEVTDDEHE